jgi:hypothetical protein
MKVRRRYLHMLIPGHVVVRHRKDHIGQIYRCLRCGRKWYT